MAKTGSSKKRGRGYLGNPENKLSVNGKSNEKPKKEKKSRGPNQFISIPNNPNSKHQDSNEDEDGEDGDEEMRMAEEMVGSGSESENEEEEEEGIQKVIKKLNPKKEKSKSQAKDFKFLMGINEKEMSRSRPEMERIKKLETKAAREEETQRLKESKKSKGKASIPSHSDSEDEEGDSTDMEGLSDDSQDQLDSEGELEELEDSFDQEDFDDSDLDALEDLEDSEEDEEKKKKAKALAKEKGKEQKKKLESRDYEREEEYQKKMKKLNKRKEIEEIEEMEDRKKRKLPVRGGDGDWKDESEDEDEDLEDGDEEAKEDQNLKDAIPKSKSSKGKEKSDASRAIHQPISAADLEDSEDESDLEEERTRIASLQEPAPTILTARRFGLAAPFEIMSLKKKSMRVLGAREQIARLATDIVGDPEIGLGMLRRLSVFAGKEVEKPVGVDEKLGEQEKVKRKEKKKGEEEIETLPIDDQIRAAALLSLLAVFVDVLPGYRIRPLSEKEENEKVNQETMRRREWEQGLVKIYQEYLELCEGVLRDRNEISPIALHCLCTLLTRAPHFNFRTNIMKCVVSRLSRRSWDSDSTKSSNALIECLHKDLQGDASLEVVRLLHRMIKERGYKVNSKVLDILLHLRLRDELGEKRASTNQAEGGKFGKGRERNDAGKDKNKPKDIRKGKGEHLSKKMVKKMRDIKEIEKEMKEAEAEINVEEREKNQTETLKLLFVLYFSILKSPSVPGSMLGSALEGLARFAHRVNVDFFRDLLSVLRVHINNAKESMESLDIGREGGNSHQDGESGASLTSMVPDGTNPTQAERGTREALLCLVTAFELLSGQGESLNIDLSDFVSHLYSILLPLSLNPNIEEIPFISGSSASTSLKIPKGGAIAHLSTLADLLFRALDLCLLRPRASTVPSERSATFIKRLLTCSLHWPPKTTLRCLGMIKTLLGRDSKLEALLDTEDRARDGKFDGTMNDVESSRPLASGEVAWELEILGTNCNEDVREAAMEILAWNR